MLELGSGEHDEGNGDTRPDKTAAGGVFVIDLTGATTLHTLAGVMSLAAACVSNDSGAMHLAGAVGTPLAAIFGPTRDRETSPLTRQGELFLPHALTFLERARQLGELFGGETGARDFRGALEVDDAERAEHAGDFASASIVRLKTSSTLPHLVQRNS